MPIRAKISKSAPSWRWVLKKRTRLLTQIMLLAQLAKMRAQCELLIPWCACAWRPYSTNCLGGEGLRNSRQRILVFSRGRASISGEVEAAKCRRLARVLTARPRSPERSCQPQRSKSTSGLFATALLAGSHQRLARIRAVRPRSPRSRRRLRLRPPPFGCSSPSPQAGAAIAAISAEASAGSASPLPLHRASPSRRVRPIVGPIVGLPCPRS